MARSGGDKEAQRLVAVLEKCRAVLDAGTPGAPLDLYDEEKAVLRPLFLLTAKPTIYVANVDEHGFKDNPLLERVRGLRRGARARRWSRSAPSSRPRWRT